MGKRRGRGEGGIRKRADGRWEASFSLPDGKRRFFYTRTQQEAAVKLRQARNALDTGMPLPTERLTVAVFAHQWLDATRPSIRPRTWQRYEEYLRIHVVPGLGKIPVARLGPADLERLYAAKLQAGLSPTTIAHLHTVIHTALAKALSWGLVGRNVAELATPPRVSRREMKTLDAAQARVFLQAAASDRFEALYVLALSTGMRQGELLGLRWQDVDLDAGTLSVTATLQRGRGGYALTEPKTPRSRRRVFLAAPAVAALRRHKVRQLEERLRLGPAWQENGLVFTSEAGRPVNATNICRREFYPLLQRCSLPKIRFHDLRHTAATLLLERGMHQKIVADMLGHSDTGTTLNLYSHTTPAMHQAAAAVMGEILGG